MREGKGFGAWSLVAVAFMAAVLAFGLGAVLSGGLAARTDAADPADGDQPAVETQVLGAVEERAPTPAPADAADTSHLVVVQVAATACGERSNGSAVLVDHDLLVTAAHVVGDAGLVRIDHGSQVLTGEVLGVFADGRDLALIELDASMVQPLPAAAVPDAGEPITFIGHPAAGTRTEIVGVRTDVPQLARQLLHGELLAASVSVPAGMSGGPAVNAAGDLLGITVAEETGTETAIVARIDDPALLADSYLVPGRCPLGT